MQPTRQRWPDVPSRRPRMAVVRPYRPNFAELAIYGEVLRDFDITYFYTGPAVAECRRELDTIGLRDMAVHRYRSHTDILSFAPLQQIVDFKFGFASRMLPQHRSVTRATLRLTSIVTSGNSGAGRPGSLAHSVS